MSRVCQLTGKRPISGNNVSHANNKTKRRFLPNLVKKKIYMPEVDRWETVKLSTNALRSVNKMGLYEFAKKQEAKGINTGIKL